MEAETVKEDTSKEAVENVPAQVAAPATTTKPHEATKKPRREDRNRKDDRTFDLFVKAVHAAAPAEQVNIAIQKYQTLLDENKKMQFYIKQSDKRHALILKEKEQLQLEFNKAILLKSKLENLCRELQKQNKSIKDESLHKIREEEERRKETQAKFQSTLAEISALLQQNNEKNTKLREDNISMTEKFKSVVQQYQIREDQVEKMSKQMELETQLNAAKMQKASLEHQAERERLALEIETLHVAVAEYRAKVKDMQDTETGLRGQLAVYTGKYDEFQSALMKSNQVFGGFKDQMEKMSKKIKTLEKESVSWKQRWESSQSALLDMCAERQAADARMVANQRQLHHMQSLCRTLQAERTVLLSTLKEHDIERPPLPAPAEPLPPPPNTASDAKVDAMAVNCAKLRQSLAHLQSQLNVLTTQQTQQAEETQPDKPKKSKNKKKSKKAAAEEAKVTEITDKVDAKVTEAVENNAGTNQGNTTEENKETTNKTAEGESVDLAVEKVDEKVLESLMQAINIANVDLCDLEVDNEMTIEEVIDGDNAKTVEEATDDQVSHTEKEDSVKVNETVEKVVNEAVEEKVIDTDAKENGVVKKNEVLEVASTESKPSPKKTPKSPKKPASPKKVTIVEPVKTAEVSNSTDVNNKSESVDA